MPPKRPASAVTAASWRRVSIVVRTGGEGAGGRGRSPGRRPAAPRRGGRRACARTPPRARSGPPASRAGTRSRRGRGAPPRSPAGASVPAIEPAIASSGELRWSTCPRASTLPSRDSSVARRGGRLRRESASPGLRPGNASSGPQVTCSTVHGQARARLARGRKPACERRPARPPAAAVALWRRRRRSARRWRSPPRRGRRGGTRRASRRAWTRRRAARTSPGSPGAPTPR